MARFYNLPMPINRKLLVVCATLIAATVAALGQATKKAPTSPAGDHVAPPAAYPNPATTPGVTNPDITQDNIATTICSKAWSTKSVRPAETYTTKLKLQQLNALGLTGQAANYEEDHFIPLEVGGNPTDHGNLWPEPWNLPVGQNDYGAHTKDFVESFIHDEVCFDIPNHKVSSSNKYTAKASVTLERGQSIIKSDWYACFQKMEVGQPCK